MERKLASIQEVFGIKAIPEADLIEVATINSWHVVVKKGEFKVGDKVIYCEIDSFLPVREQFEFLRKSSFKKMGDKEGFRLKTIKLRGQVSQGLIMPISMLPESFLSNLEESEMVGVDVTDILNIIKWEPPISAQLSGVARGNFPSFIPKTDEERIQNLTKKYTELSKNSFYVTEKLDGSSATFYYNNGFFGVCSRNLDLIETDGNSFWQAARSLNLEAILSEMGNYALQGELIGEGIQGNPYKIKGNEVYFFNVFDIDQQKYLPFDEFVGVISRFGLSCVPILLHEYRLPESIDELLLFAEGKSDVCADTEREGLVIRSHNRLFSFKAISNKFLLKEK